MTSPTERPLLTPLTRARGPLDGRAGPTIVSRRADGRRFRRALRQTLTAMSAGCVLVVLALLPSAALAAGGDVLFVLDTSRSMNWVVGQDHVQGTPSRLDIARASLLERLDRVPSSRGAGLVQFPAPGTECGVANRVPLSSRSRDDLRATLSTLARGDGSTPPASAIQQAGIAVLRQNRPARVIVLTDGDERCGGDPVATAASLRQLGVDLEIHVIGFAVDDRARSLLRRLADAGGGQYYDAADGAALDRALDDSMGTSSDSWGTELGKLIGTAIVAERERKAARSQRGTTSVRIKLKNRTGEPLGIRFRSADDPSRTWPEALNKEYHRWIDEDLDVTLSCRRGELVCYGASHVAVLNPYWGMGRHLDQSCTDCCAVCDGGTATFVLPPR